MLKSLELENFKAFGNRVKIPFAPITLIFGENSAGKSSILHSINLLKQTIESRDRGSVLLLPRTEEGLVDLGSFQELVFDHDLKKKVTFCIEFDLRKSLDQKRAPQMESGSMEITLHRPSAESEVQLDNIILFINWEGERIKLAQFKPKAITKDQRRRLSFRAEPALLTSRITGSERISGAECVWLTDDPRIWRQYFEKAKRSRDEIADRLINIKNIIQNKEISPEDIFEESVIFTPESRIKGIQEAINFYSKEFSLDDFIKRMSLYEQKAVIGLEGFMPYSTSFPFDTGVPEDGYLARMDYKFRGGVSLNIGNYAQLIGKSIRFGLRQIFPLGPFRRPPERWYMFTGTNPQDVGYRGNLLPDLLLRNPDILEKTNKWLNKLSIGYKLKVSSLTDRNSDLFEVRLFDTIRNEEVEVCLPDVGFGISQILPFIVQSLASSNQTITIEQPEVHIHPRLQADLGDLLIEAIKKPHANQFIIETHSEHLILRLLRRIRETAEKDESNSFLLNPNQISILYVKRSKKGSEVVHIPVLSNGEFALPWPQGFFAERTREL